MTMATKRTTKTIDLSTLPKPLFYSPKWQPFTPGLPANRQKLPEPKKWVLVQLDTGDRTMPNPVVVGYLKYAAGVKTEPYFVTPGAAVPKYTPDRVIAWCDALNPGFDWPEPKN